MPSFEIQGWSPSVALRPCIAVSGAFAYGLYVLSAPQHYQHRLGNGAVIFALSAGFFQSFRDLFPDDTMNYSFALGILIWLVHMAHVAVFRGDAGYIAGNSAKSEELSEGNWTAVSAPELSPYHRAYKMLWNFRGIGTSWQVVKTANRQLQDETTNGIQSRRQFFQRQIFTVFCRYLGLAIFFEISDPYGLIGPRLSWFPRTGYPPCRVC